MFKSCIVPKTKNNTANASNPNKGAILNIFCFNCSFFRSFSFFFVFFRKGAYAHSVQRSIAPVRTRKKKRLKRVKARR